MRYITPLLLLITIAGLSSCSRYQYMTLNSSQMTHNDKHQLVFENDTVRITYDFGGKNAPVSVNIYNKTSQPLYVNWKKSALIRNEHSISYFDRNIYFSGSSTTYGYHNRYFAAAGSNFSGSMELQEGTDFIAPQSSFSKGLFTLSMSGPLAVEVPDSLPAKHSDYDYSNNMLKYRELKYDQDNSPIRFRSYLMFTMGMNTPVEFSEVHDFYVSEAMDTKAAPDMFNLYQQQGNKFFVKYHVEQH